MAKIVRLVTLAWNLFSHTMLWWFKRASCSFEMTETCSNVDTKYIQSYRVRIGRFMKYRLKLTSIILWNNLRFVKEKRLIYGRVFSWLTSVGIAFADTLNPLNAIRLHCSAMSFDPTVYSIDRNFIFIALFRLQANATLSLQTACTFISLSVDMSTVAYGEVISRHLKTLISAQYTIRVRVTVWGLDVLIEKFFSWGNYKYGGWMKV